MYKHPSFVNRRKPKIIALTARAMSGVKKTCIEFGMNDYLTKPMQIEVLNAKIQQQLVDIDYLNLQKRKKRKNKSQNDNFIFDYHKISRVAIFLWVLIRVCCWELSQ